MNSLTNPLSETDDYTEFQVGSKLVWVSKRNPVAEGNIQAANKCFAGFWSAIPEVEKLAEGASRRWYPVLWSEHDASGVEESPLCVWGLWFYPDTGEAPYEVNYNHCYTGEADFPEDGVMVIRYSSGALTLGG
ncbi:hypothetical protein L4D15_23970 [Enterovibrio norvegicus]|uniref:hypothetical protein n=1 Tax=Enterovibrio norvegicus TaxID=188144 RepID=UPI003D115185